MVMLATAGRASVKRQRLPSPGVALTVASANCPNADEPGAVALYGVVTALVGYCGHMVAQPLR